ncbi:DEAD/DEAH box helicase family protein [Paraglaciecola sp. 25GB23A]|jgi:superfamily II DNA or RNA helicase|uniref:DEAD/DEAH box helicase n=1 Tax=Paraglaciecola sp. 25GB23A TaxID=3156068 RepID=UPI0032B012BE
MLRTWQLKSIKQALKKYFSGKSHFLCQATPGAGKTIMAAQLTKELFNNGKIDFVLCFSPSLSVAEGIKSTFSRTLECTFNGEIGSIGASSTYQSLKYIDKSFWVTMQKYRVFVVFDEIHHCSGDNFENANVWGEQILAIQNLAKYTLALSGTPWRSDLVPIAMSEYTDPEGQLICDYQYGLKQAIDDGVCRRPRIVLVDNEHLSISSGFETQSFSSILELLEESDTSYVNVIQNREAMTYLLSLACRQLDELRMQDPFAGGLVVASSVNHAKIIQGILTNEFNQTSVLVTHYQESALADIDEFRNSAIRWIISVGMISEGTDIPRLQVCCHLSAIKTELHFRQVLGRILRVTPANNQKAWLFTFAERNLIGFAERVEQNIPDACVFAKMGAIPQLSDRFGNHSKILQDLANLKEENEAVRSLEWFKSEKAEFHESVTGNIISPQEIRLGRFKERILAAFG